MRTLLSAGHFSLAFFFLLGSLATAQAQDKKDVKAAEKLVKSGDELYEYGEYISAHQKYEEATKLVPNDAAAHYKAGLSAKQIHEKVKQLNHFERAYKLDPNVQPDVSFQLADAYRLNSKFDRAIEYFNVAKQRAIGNAEALEIIEYHLGQSQLARDLVANPKDVTIEHMGRTLNSAYDDYSPVINADQTVLIFTSRREGSMGGLQMEDGSYYEDLYISEFGTAGWSKPRNMTEINSEDHEGSVGLSPSGDKLIIYKSDGGGDLYYCKKDKKTGQWTKPQRFPKQISSPRSYEPSATITEDGLTLFFVSDRDGGLGGLDIYEVHRPTTESEWGEPKNIGGPINTAFDEDAPFMDLDGQTLYYSSKRVGGMGGYDIFSSVYDSLSGEWSEPENLGYPINSVEDDIFFILSGDGQYAYFNSDKPGGVGEEDLYRFKMPERADKEERAALVSEITGKEPEPLPEPQPVIVTGRVFDGVSNAGIGGAQVQLLEGGEVVEGKTTGSDGTYRFTIAMDRSGKHTVSAEASGYPHGDREITIPEPATRLQQVRADIPLSKPQVGQTMVLRNVYFDFNKSTLKDKSFNELDKLVRLLQEHPSATAELGGHTDNIGSDSYNQQLSQRRAKAVVDYLVGKGIDRARLEPVGYGESKPIASNDDEEEGRELNRRTEFTLKGL